MRAFQIRYSEGDPIIVIADDFAEALKGYTAALKASDGIDEEQSASWIEGVDVVGEEIVLTEGAKLQLGVR